MKTTAAVQYTWLIEILSDDQKRLVYVLSSNPTAHVYSPKYLSAQALTADIVSAGLRFLLAEGIVKKDGGGVYRVAHPEVERLFRTHGARPENGGGK